LQHHTVRFQVVYIGGLRVRVFNLVGKALQPFRMPRDHGYSIAFGHEPPHTSQPSSFADADDKTMRSGQAATGA
jgi:hypothetical protein